MKVENLLYPNHDQMKGFFDNEDDGKPIYMVNLLKFRDKAEYKDGRETSLTGREAYRLYAEVFEKYLIDLGGEITFVSEVSRLTIGKVENLWDSIAIAKWPSKKIMGESMNPNEPHILEAYQHRSAGLEGQLNIETKELKSII